MISHLLFLSRSVQSHVITYGTPMIFRHWKQELDLLPANCNKRVNSLSEEVKSCDSVNSFKHPLKKNKTVPGHYYTGRRKAYIYTNYSALTIDLFTRNVAEPPLYRCESIEDAQHFFFHCGYYTFQGHVFLNATSALISSHSTILKVLYVWRNSTFP